MFSCFNLQRDDSDDEPEDSVRLWEYGWKERYFQNKFGVSMDVGVNR